MLLHVFLLLVAGCFCDEAIIGNVRIQTLSPTLVRVENIGPQGFEDRTTFMVVNRNAFPGIPITSINRTTGTVYTRSYSVSVVQTNPPTDACYGQSNIDVQNSQRSPFYPNGASASNAGACCSLCQRDENCNGWVFETDSGGTNCWPLNSWGTTTTNQNRIFGCLGNTCVSSINSITIQSASGDFLKNFILPGSGSSNILQWPNPLAQNTYLISDYPRFFVPSWGPTPNLVIPKNPNTNGYDFSNNQNGDYYIFLLGNSIDTWWNSRAEFLKLTGPTPVLPDYSFGTWFTYWHSYSEQEAKHDISMWEQGGLPLNVYGLDMNWRNTSNRQDRFYSHPNTALFRNFTEWFSFLHGKGLKTYFNDHPFPVDWQTSPSEVGFRYGGLREWMDRGLDYWWFDHNWGFSIPPPNVFPINGWDTSNTDGNWLGLDNAAWGSHIYHESVAQYYKNKGSNERAITLSKFARPDWRSNMDPSLHAEHPAHHRFPVWWTGDGVDLQASVHSMVDAGIQDFKPYVHSDCGGDYRGTGGDLLRWAEHCVFGTILRFHGEDHRPWTYTSHIENVILTYLKMRYKLIPSFIAGGQGTLYAGFPIVARCDLYWPKEQSAFNNEQYIHLNDTLIAPIWQSANNVTTRSVWIPPGLWQDAWSGLQTPGPRTITVSLPYEQLPMWHKRGGFLLTVDSDATRVQDQDWSEITLEVFPDIKSTENITRILYSLENAKETHLSMNSVYTNGVGIINFQISPTGDEVNRGWVVRLHLLPGEVCVSAVADGLDLDFVHIEPVDEKEVFFPFGGKGTRPAAKAGMIAELVLPKSAESRTLRVKVLQK